MLSTVLNIIIFEDCRNQWSMSRPLLGLILLNEKVNISPRPLKLCACVWYNTSILCIPAVFCWPEEQHRQQPATGEAAGHALMFRELDGGNREEPTNKEPRQVGCKIKITGRAVGGRNKARADSRRTFFLVMANSLFKLISFPFTSTLLQNDFVNLSQLCPCHMWAWFISWPLPWSRALIFEKELINLSFCVFSSPTWSYCQIRLKNWSCTSI